MIVATGSGFWGDGLPRIGEAAMATGAAPTTEQGWDGRRFARTGSMNAEPLTSALRPPRRPRQEGTRGPSPGTA